MTGCGKTPGLMAVTDFCEDLIYQRTMRGNDQKGALLLRDKVKSSTDPVVE
jgi:hypothetical protein